MGNIRLGGPRPAFALETDNLSQTQRMRLLVKPVLTGPWKVSCRSYLSFEKAIELDFFCLENQSLWLEFKIPVKTGPAVLSRRGAL